METDKETVDREGITYCGQVSAEKIYNRYLQVHFTYPDDWAVNLCVRIMKLHCTCIYVVNVQAIQANMNKERLYLEFSWSFWSGSVFCGFPWLRPPSRDSFSCTYRLWPATSHPLSVLYSYWPSLSRGSTNRCVFLSTQRRVQLKGFACYNSIAGRLLGATDWSLGRTNKNGFGFCVPVPWVR